MKKKIVQSFLSSNLDSVVFGAKWTAGIAWVAQW